MTIESINRQIEAFNQLALALRNARQGITTSPFSLEMTKKAQEAVTTGLKLPEIKARTQANAPIQNITVTVKDNSFLGDVDIVEKIGNPIIRVLQQHAAIVSVAG